MFQEVNAVGFVGNVQIAVFTARHIRHIASSIGVVEDWVMFETMLWVIYIYMVSILFQLTTWLKEQFDETQCVLSIDHEQAK